MPKPSEIIYKIRSVYSNGRYRGDFDFLNDKIEAIIQYLDEQYEAGKSDEEKWLEDKGYTTKSKP